MADPFWGLFIENVRGLSTTPGFAMQTRVFASSTMSLFTNLLLIGIFRGPNLNSTTNELRFIATLIPSVFVTPWIVLPLAWPTDQDSFDLSVFALFISPGLWLMPLLCLLYGIKIWRGDHPPQNQGPLGLILILAIQAIPTAVALAGYLKS